MEVGRRNGSRGLPLGWIIDGVEVGTWRIIRLEPGFRGALESLRSTWLSAPSARGELLVGGSSEGVAAVQPSRRIEVNRATMV